MNRVQDYRSHGPPYGPGRGGQWTDGRSSSGVGKRLRVFAGVVATAFAVTLAVVIGQRLSDQAISILAGAVCGVGASIPTSLLIVWVTRRRQQDVRPNQPLPGVYPPVVVVQQPPQPSGSVPQQLNYLSPYAAQPIPREFTVVGGGMEEPNYNHCW